MRKTFRIAGLIYSCDTDPGYSRRRCGKGFIFLGLRGSRLTGKRVKQRIENLVIPPAWEDVWICRDASGHLQVTGRDEKQRKQYIYHPKWESLREQNKFEQLISFGEALPGIRRTVTRDLRKPPMSRHWVLALTVRILDETLIRVGNEIYAKTHNSYGLTTLRDRHVEINNGQALFHFKGKSGRDQEILLEDQRLTGLVARCQELPGQHLFQYVNEHGEQCPLGSEDVNAYLKSISGLDVTAKVFRTWGATVEAASQLKKSQSKISKAKKQKEKVAAVRAVAELLGNTPAVAKNSYIAPIVFEVFETGKLAENMKRKRSSVRGLTASEQSVLDLLRSSSS